MATTVLIGISDNQGYAPDQVETQVTLASLLEDIERAIEEHGADAKVVLSNGQRYGAGFGRFIATHGEVYVSDAARDDDEDEYY